MFLKERGFWGAFGLVGYACLTSANASGWSPATTAPLALLPALLVVGFRGTETPAGAPEAPSAGARPAARATFTGACVLAAALAGPQTIGLAALAHAGAGIASVGGLVAIARTPSAPGVLTTPPGAMRLDIAVVIAFAWSIAVALPLFGAFSPDPGVVPPVTVALAGLFAAIATLVALLIALVRSLRARPLELGLRERLALPLGLGAVTLASGIAASALELVRPERALPAAAALVATFTAIASSARAADTVSRWARFAFAIGAPVGAISLAAAYVAKSSPERAAPAVLVATGAAAVFGLASPRLARRVAPESHKWLDTLADANAAAMSADPEPALVKTLGALARNGKSTVTLYLVDPPEALSSDRSGHVRREPAGLPASVVELSREEPEHILRRDAIGEAAVRRADARKVHEWLAEREIDAGVAIFDEEETVGLLAISHADRKSPWTLEEVRALRQLGDRIGAVVAVTAKLRRSWERERATRETHASFAADLAHTRADIDARSERAAELLERIARPARAATYAPASRIVVEQLDKWALATSRVTLITAPGVDALAFAAHLHLASPKRLAPFVVVDGAANTSGDLMEWRSETASPLVKARGGTLVLVDPHLLNKLVQSYIGVALDESTSLVVTVPVALDVLVAEEKLEARFVDAVGDRVVVLPTLDARAEDLRALAMTHLAEIGARFRGKPLGIDPEALSMLLEHDWRGNDAELVGVLTRAVATSTGDTIRRADLPELHAEPRESTKRVSRVR